MKNIYLGMAIVIFIFNGIMLYKNHQTKMSLRSEISKIEEEKEELQRRILLHVENTCTDLKIDPAVGVSDENGQVTRFSSLIKSSEKLIFRFTERNCPSCIEQELLLINKLARSIGKHHILLLSSFGGVNDLKIFKKENQIDLPIYNIPISAMEANKIEEINFPYLFVLDSLFKTSFVYLPDKSGPALSLLYYKMIAKRFEETIEKEKKVIAQHKTSVSFFSTEYDFKKIRSNTKIEKEFRLKNTGKGPLVITLVKTNCGCTVPQWPEVPILPGEESVIKLTYDSSRIGFFNRDAYVFANTGDSPIKLTITGEVIQ